MKDHTDGLELFDGGRWFRFPKAFCKILTHRDAIFLAAFVNIACREQTKADGVFFLCTDKHIENEIGASEKTIRLALQSLKDKSIITWKVQGMPARRWMQIHSDVIQNLLDGDSQFRPKGRNQFRPKGRNQLRPKGLNCNSLRIIKKENTIERAPARVREDNAKQNTTKIPEKQKTIWEKMVRYYIRSTTIEHKRPPRIKTWASRLKELHTKQGVPVKDIKTMLKWYCSKYDRNANPYHRKYLPPFIPQTTTIPGFIQKWDAICCAFGREQEDGVATEVNMSTTKKVISHELQTHYDKMHAVLIKIPRVRIETLFGLADSLLDLEHRIEAVIEMCDPKLHSMYKGVLIDYGQLSDSYASWIQFTVQQWDTWSGDLSLFHAGTKHVVSYVTQLLRSRGIGDSKGMEKILDECKKREG